MKNLFTAVLSLFILALLHASPAAAAQITFVATGQVTTSFNYGGLLFHYFPIEPKVGDLISYEYTFESTTPSNGQLPPAAAYYYGAIVSSKLTVGTNPPYVFLPTGNGPGEADYIYVLGDSSSTYYTIVGGVNPSAWSFSIDAVNGPASYFPNNALPIIPPDITLFRSSGFGFATNNFGPNAVVTGVLDRITLAGAPPPPPPVSTVPVLLVHGWCGKPNSDTWGEMKSQLEASGFHVGYSTNLPDSIETRIPKLSAYLSLEIDRLLRNPTLNPLGSLEVDIVAHSMGGLVTRALIAGLAVDQDGFTVPYKANIRRLVELATPNYGVNVRAYQAAWNPLCPAPKDVSETQARQMEFGSGFIWHLHQHWLTSSFDNRNILTVVGTGLGYSDSVVRIPSATMSDSRVRARFVNRNHITLPLSARGIVDIENANDESLSLVRAFLRAVDPMDSDPTEIECPRMKCKHVEDLPAGTAGVLMMRLLDSASGNSITINKNGAVGATLYPAPSDTGFFACTGQISQLVGCDLNRDTSSITFVALSPVQYQVEIFSTGPGPRLVNYWYGPSFVPNIPRIESARTTLVDRVFLQRVKPMK